MDILNILSWKKIRSDDKLYEISDANKRGYAILVEQREITPEYRKKLENPKFYWQEEYRRNEQLKKNQLKIINLIGKKGGDIIPKGTQLFFSKRFVQFLEKNNIGGFNKYPINLISKNKLPQYYYLEFNYLAHRKEKNEQPDTTSLYVITSKFDSKNNLYFDLSNYNGDDVFGIQKSPLIIVTKRLKDMINKEHFSNIEFEPISIYK